MKNFNVILCMSVVILFLIVATIYGATIGVVGNISRSIKVDFQRLIQLDKGRMDIGVNETLQVPEEKMNREIDNMFKYKRLIDCSA